MKKIISILLIFTLLITGLLVLTGCEKEEEQKVEMKQLEYLDEKTGTKVTFDYPITENYEIFDEDDEGKAKEIDFENEGLNLSINMYVITGDYEYDKEVQSESDNFKEYSVGGHEAFMYTQSNGLTIQNKILLKPETDEEDAVSLYMYIEQIDTEKNDNLIEQFNSEEFQRFLNSIKYEKVN